MKINLPYEVKKIIEILEENGFEAYAVGGSVRDSILGKEPEDWDITTSAKPEEVKKIFRVTFDTGIEHGTITVRMNKKNFEVTTYRVDGDYKDSRHPESVEFTASLEEDLKRRDFTINAMAYNDEKGLVDIFGGQEDLKTGIIRAVGNPYERFQEDALRIMRCIRFAAQLGFFIEDETYEAAKTLSANLKDISVERIREELLKIITSSHPEYVLKLEEIGGMDIFFTEFKEMLACEQNTDYHVSSVGRHTVLVMQNVRPEKILRLSALFHDVGKMDCKTTDEKGMDHFPGHAKMGAEKTQKILRALKFDNDTLKRVCHLVEYHESTSFRHEITPKKVRVFLSKFGEKDFEYLLELMEADRLGKSEIAKEAGAPIVPRLKECYDEIIEKGECFKISDLAVNGNDLIQLGYSGKEIGKILGDLLNVVLDQPQLNKKELLLQRIRT